MTKSLIYIVGEPGAGKSTALAAATADWRRFPQTAPLAHDLLVGPHDVIEAVELGKRREAFSGTDALPMNAITKAEQMLARPPAPVIIAEGARLGVRRFFEHAVSLGYEVTLYNLTTPYAEKQRGERGAEQKESWVKGARTRAANIASAAITGVHHRTIDGSETDFARLLSGHISDAIFKAHHGR